MDFNRIPEVNKKPDIVIGLCVYDNEYGLPFVLLNISKLSDIFNKIRVVAFYDDSEDRSLDILNLYRDQNNNLDILINNSSERKKEERTKNIAFARNKILDYIRNNYSDYPFFAMMDSNEYSCIGEIRPNVILNVLQRQNEWDAISFDREAGYYDTWALSFDPFIYSFFHFQNWRTVVDQMRESFTELLNKYRNENREEYIPVFSAFNGFCLYKTEKFLDCNYSSSIDLAKFPECLIQKQIQLTGIMISPHLEGDCEHRHFHLEAIKKNGVKIRICTESLFAKVFGITRVLRGPA